MWIVKLKTQLQIMTIPITTEGLPMMRYSKCFKFYFMTAKVARSWVVLAHINMYIYFKTYCTIKQMTKKEVICARFFFLKGIQFGLLAEHGARLWRLFVNLLVTCIRYSTIETKEAARIGNNGFLFPHEYSGEGRRRSTMVSDVAEIAIWQKRDSSVAGLKQKYTGSTPKAYTTHPKQWPRVIPLSVKSKQWINSEPQT